MENKLNWIDYWNSEDICNDKDIDWKMKKNMELFIKTTNPLLNYNSQDIILDVGCGPGHLANFLKDRVKEIHCLDISQHYIDMNRERFKQEQNLFFYKLNDYIDFSFLKPKFSIIICLSVIQYYKDINEVEKLIKTVKSIALPGARFLIADIPIGSGKFSDGFSILKSGFREKCLLNTLKFLLHITFTKYRKMRDSLGLLNLSVEKLNELIAKLNLHAKVLDTPLTDKENRRHLLINF